MAFASPEGPEAAVDDLLQDLVLSSYGGKVRPISASALADLVPPLCGLALDESKAGSEDRYRVLVAIGVCYLRIIGQYPGLVEKDPEEAPIAAAVGPVHGLLLSFSVDRCTPYEVVPFLWLLNVVQGNLTAHATVRSPGGLHPLISKVDALVSRYGMPPCYLPVLVSCLVAHVRLSPVPITMPRLTYYHVKARCGLLATPPDKTKSEATAAPPLDNILLQQLVGTSHDDDLPLCLVAWCRMSARAYAAHAASPSLSFWMHCRKVSSCHSADVFEDAVEQAAQAMLDYGGPILPISQVFDGPEIKVFAEAVAAKLAGK